MKFKKLQFLSLAVLLFALCLPQQSMAQFSIGGSYEMRSESPENGFGIRLEREILRPIPIVDIGLRAHFSYFNEDFEGNEQTAPGDLTFYDYGLAATGGVSVGLLKPYVGVGIGNNHVDYDVNSGTAELDSDDNNVFFNGFIGTELNLIPRLNPFVEYRFEPSDSFNEIDDNLNSDGRFIIGVSLAL